MTTKEVPLRACRLQAAPAALTFADGAAGQGGEAKQSKGRFALRPVVSGQVIPGHWFWGNLAMDLQGFQAPTGSIPALLQHDVQQRLGFTDKVAVEDGVGLVAEGPLLQNDLAAQVRQESKDGFPWQASAYVVPLSVEEVLPGMTAEANGQTVHGPGTIFRTWLVREVSFATLGADANTAGEAFASGGQTLTVDTLEESEPMTKTTTGGSPANPAGPAAKLTGADLQTQHPEGAAEIRLAGAQAERGRVQAILAASDPAQAELVGKLIGDGTPLAEATAALNADLRQRLQQAREQFAQGPGAAPLTRQQAPAGGGPRLGDAELKAKALDQNVDAKAFAELVRPEFVADTKLAEEFPSLEAFAAYRRAELRGSFRSSRAAS